MVKENRVVQNYKSKGIADYVYSEDMDVSYFWMYKVFKMFEQKRLLCRNIFDNILENLGMSQDEFIDLCILCGCDYTCTIPRVGMMTSLQSY